MTIDTIWLLVAFAGGAALATIITLIWARPKAGKQAVVQLKEAHDEYRGEVATHFVDTAKLVNEMTDSYKALFDHLQQGAEGLLDEETMRERLGVDAAEVITLSRLGFRSDEGEQTPVAEALSAESENADADDSIEKSAPADSDATTDLETEETAPSDLETTDDNEAESEQADAETATADTEASTDHESDSHNDDSSADIDEDATEQVAVDQSASDDTSKDDAEEGSDAIDPKLASVEAANDAVPERREPQIA